MKTNLLLFVSILLLFACSSNTQKKEEKTENPTATESQKIENQEKESTISLISFEALGYFDTNKDELFLNIPVPSEDFRILEVKPISNVNNGDLINAIAVRVSDDKPSPASDRPQFFINTTRSLKSLKLDVNELKKDKELIVITYNSVDKFKDEELNSLKTCISIKGRYSDPENCKEQIRKDNKPFIPNDRKGSVIKGL
jgi:hypothetical protein